MNFPKFTIANNEMDGTNDWYVVHMQEPIFWAKVHHHNTQEEQSDFHDYIFDFAEKNKASVLVGRSQEPDYLFTLLFLGQIGENTQENVDKMAKLIREMTDFYIEYLKFEDQNF